MWPTLDAPCLKQMHPVFFFQFYLCYVQCSYMKVIKKRVTWNELFIDTGLTL